MDDVCHTNASREACNAAKGLPGGVNSQYGTVNPNGVINGYRVGADFYLNTDTNQFFIFNGVPRSNTGWIEFSGFFLDITNFGASTSATDNISVLEDVSILAAVTGKIIYIPAGAFTVLSEWNPPSNITVMGSGPDSIIRANGNFRPIVVDSVSHVKLERFKVAFTGGGANSVGLRFVDAEDCYYCDIVVDTPNLNGVEVVSSFRVHGERIKVLSPTFFGIFYFGSLDCTDTDCYIYRPGGFSFEFKSSKRCISVRLKIIEPQAEHGVYFWTGLDGAPNESPGPMLNEYCGCIDLYVKGAATSKHLLYVNASPNCFVRGAILEPHPSGWASVSIGSTFFYNEGTSITGTVTSGSPTITGVSDPDGQLVAGSRIHIAGSAINHTVQSVALPNVTLTANSDINASGALIGFVASPNHTLLKDIKIIGPGSGVADNINIAGTADDPLVGIILDNVRSERAGRFGMTVSHATVKAKSGYSKESLGLNEWNLSTGADVSADGVTFSSGLAGNTYGVVVTNGAILRWNHSEAHTFNILGVSCVADGDLLYMNGGEIRDCQTHAVAIRANSSIIGTRIKNSRNGAGSFGGQVSVLGNGNLIESCTFDKGTSADLDSHIKEGAGVSGNKYGPNNFIGGLTNDIIYASGSNSISVPPRHMTKAVRDAITSPADGMEIYQTDNTPGVRYREAGAWVKPTVTADP